MAHVGRAIKDREQGRRVSKRERAYGYRVPRLIIPIPFNVVIMNKRRAEIKLRDRVQTGRTNNLFFHFISLPGRVHSFSLFITLAATGED